MPFPSGHLIVLPGAKSLGKAGPQATPEFTSGCLRGGTEYSGAALCRGAVRGPRGRILVSQTKGPFKRVECASLILSNNKAYRKLTVIVL